MGDEIYSFVGRRGALRGAAERISPSWHPDVLGRLEYVYALSGRRQKARAIADTLRSRYKKGQSDEPYDLAVVYAGLGEKDRALTWLDTAYLERLHLGSLSESEPRAGLAQVRARVPGVP